jgi:hypothetical protein
MGWDITYHPVADSEIRDIYFRALEDVTLVEPLQQQFRIEPFYMEQLQERIDEARSISRRRALREGACFVPGDRGRSPAKVSLSSRERPFVLHRRSGGCPLFRGLASTGAATVGGRRFRQPLRENYSGGVFITHDRLKQMRADYVGHNDLRARLDELFSDGRLAVFWSVCR